MKKINAKNAPEAIGPYCHAVVHGNTAFLSGQIGLDPLTMKIVDGSIAEQTRQVFENIQAVLDSLGSGSSDVIKTTVFLTSMTHFSDMNTIYEDFFKKHTPARSTIEVSGLPKDALIEIECIVAIE